MRIDISLSLLTVLVDGAEPGATPVFKSCQARSGVDATGECCFKMDQYPDDINKQFDDLDGRHIRVRAIMEGRSSRCGYIHYFDEQGNPIAYFAGSMSGSGGRGDLYVAPHIAPDKPLNLMATSGPGGHDRIEIQELNKAKWRAMLLGTKSYLPVKYSYEEVTGFQGHLETLLRVHAGFVLGKTDNLFNKDFRAPGEAAAVPGAAAAAVPIALVRSCHAKAGIDQYGVCCSNENEYPDDLGRVDEFRAGAVIRSRFVMANPVSVGSSRECGYIRYYNENGRHIATFAGSMSAGSTGTLTVGLVKFDSKMETPVVFFERINSDSNPYTISLNRIYAHKFKHMKGLRRLYHPDQIQEATDNLNDLLAFHSDAVDGIQELLPVE